MPTEAAALYNEIEPYAAAWLRNLIALGEIPDGVVDERSIVDVRGDDLAGCDVHFFAGIGVWARAVAEAEQASNRRLARPLFTGSCPCQPLSSAGQRKGHVDERHLWPAFHRLIAERRPATILGEQVASKDGREWMAAVRHDLEASGYAVGTAILPACGLGAPHIRYRLFWVADADGAGLAQREYFGGLRRQAGVANQGQAVERGRVVGGLADAGRRGQLEPIDGSERPEGVGAGQSVGPGGGGFAADARDDGRQGRLSGRVDKGWGDLDRHAGRGGAIGGLADANGEWRPQVDQGDDAIDQQRPPVRRGQFQPAGAGASGAIRGGDHIAAGDGGWPPGEMARMAWPSAPHSFWSDADWIFCRDNKWRPIESGSFPLVDGSAFLLGSGGPYEGMSRAGMLRGYGNAVVLPVARAFVECAMEALYAH
jgi:DNA (cytosine-5)-methyltransferase 1